MVGIKRHLADGQYRTPDERIDFNYALDRELKLPVEPVDYIRFVSIIMMARTV